MQQRPRLAIVADDLTGLQAIAGEFRRLGFTVRSFLSTDDVALDASVDIVGVDTDTRHRTQADATAAVQRVAALLRDRGITHFYKQADSGMQGHLAAEIEAMARVLESPGIVYAPSCPILGRVTRDGWQIEPGVLNVDICALWAAQTGTTPTCCKVNHWAEPGAARRSHAWVVDAESDAELVDLARHATASATDEATPWLLAGSVGFASAIATVWRIRWPDANARPVLVVAGSLQASTRKQIEVLAQTTDAQVVDVPTTHLDARACDTIALRLRDALLSGKHAVLAPQGGQGGGSGKPYPYLHREAQEALAHNLEQVLRRTLAPSAWPLLAGVFVAGGNTSELLVRRVMSAARLEVDAWLGPGVTAARAVMREGHAMPLVTKAGTWGGLDIVVRGIQWIVEEDRRQRALQETN